MFEYDDVELVLFGKLWGWITSCVLFNKRDLKLALAGTLVREHKRIPAQNLGLMACSGCSGSAQDGSGWLRLCSAMLRLCSQVKVAVAHVQRIKRKQRKKNLILSLWVFWLQHLNGLSFCRAEKTSPLLLTPPSYHAIFNVGLAIAPNCCQVCYFTSATCSFSSTHSSNQQNRSLSIDIKIGMGSNISNDAKNQTNCIKIVIWSEF